MVNSGGPGMRCLGTAFCRQQQVQRSGWERSCQVITETRQCSRTVLDAAAAECSRCSA